MDTMCQQRLEGGNAGFGLLVTLTVSQKSACCGRWILTGEEQSSYAREFQTLSTGLRGRSFGDSPMTTELKWSQASPLEETGSHFKDLYGGEGLLKTDTKQL